MFPGSPNQTAMDSVPQNREVPVKAAPKHETASPRPEGSHAKTPDKYFIMKSLTIEDMELSVRNNTWATQAHNEDALNAAYEVCQVTATLSENAD